MRVPAACGPRCAVVHRIAALGTFPGSRATVGGRQRCRRSQIEGRDPQADPGSPWVRARRRCTPRPSIVTGAEIPGTAQDAETASATVVCASRPDTTRCPVSGSTATIPWAAQTTVEQRREPLRTGIDGRVPLRQGRLRARPPVGISRGGAQPRVPTAARRAGAGVPRLDRIGERGHPAGSPCPPADIGAVTQAT